MSSMQNKLECHIQYDSGRDKETVLLIESFH